MDNKEARIIVNQRRQTRWFKDYHTNYKKKAGGTQKCSHFRSRKRKNGLKIKNQRDRASYTAEKAALVISA